MFIKPTQHDLANLQQILEYFGEATRMKTNIYKTKRCKIHCEDLDLDNVLAQFGGQTCCFPCKYLGLPLQIGRTRWANEHILIHKIGAYLAGVEG